MADLYRDNYSKAYPFDFIDGVGRGYCFAAGADDNWYHARTINSKTEARAILATNRTASRIPFNAYLYDSPRATAENFFFFSENIYAGVTNGRGWANFGTQNDGGTTGIVGQARYSRILMPDGSTNGVITRTENQSANSGVYQAFPSTSFLPKGVIYTASVWACGDSGGGAYTTSPTMRISYYSQSLDGSVFSPDFQLSEIPVRVSWTFVSNEGSGSAFENIAFGSGSGSPPAAQLVFWGAQLIEGTVPGSYLPTSTNWNKFITGIGSSTTTVGAASPDHYNIVSVPFIVPANSSQLFDIAPFTISTNNSGASTPEISIYGLY
jgi:hypothetical protein